MVTLLLLRHAPHSDVGEVLSGRLPGARLGESGRRLAARLGARVAREAPVALLSSPQERARETAKLVGAACGLETQTEIALDEIDFGAAWTGRRFADLAGEPAWQRWNAERAASRPPGGESMGEAQARMLAWMATLPSRFADGTVAVVSHADVIKAALFGVLGLTLDVHWRLEIAPASVSAVRLGRGSSDARVLLVNEAA